MGVSFSVAGYGIGCIRIRHKTSTKLSNSLGDDILGLKYPIPDPVSIRRNVLNTKTFVLGPICDLEAHLGRFGYPTAML